MRWHDEEGFIEVPTRNFYESFTSSQGSQVCEGILVCTKKTMRTIGKVCSLFWMWEKTVSMTFVPIVIECRSVVDGGRGTKVKCDFHDDFDSSKLNFWKIWKIESEAKLEGWG